MAADGATQATIAQGCFYVRVAQWRKGLVFVVAQTVTLNLSGVVQGSESSRPLPGRSPEQLTEQLGLLGGKRLQLGVLSSDAAGHALGSQPVAERSTRPGQREAFRQSGLLRGCSPFPWPSTSSPSLPSLLLPPQPILTLRYLQIDFPV